MALLPRVFISLLPFFLFLPLSYADNSPCEILLKYGPRINHSELVGSVRLTRPSSSYLNSCSEVTGELIVPGRPRLYFHHNAEVGPTRQESGPAWPRYHRVHVNSHASLGGLVTCADPTPFPTATAPRHPTGWRSVHLRRSNQSVQDFSSVRNLTLSHRHGPLTLPPGRYHRINLNSCSVLRLGTPGATAAELYEIRSLNVNRWARIEVLGPVELRLKSSFNPNGPVGNEEHPEWLQLSVSHGSLSLNNRACLYAHATVPCGYVSLNAHSLFKGQLAACQLFLNNCSRLVCVDDDSEENLPPLASNSSTQTSRDTPVSLTLQATDPESLPLTFELLSPPQSGVIEGLAGSTLPGSTLTYTPNPGFVGNDTFTFVASDGVNSSEPATVTISVLQINRPPIASDLSFVINQGEADSPILLSGFDPDDDPLTFTVLTQPEHGMLTGTPPDLAYTHTGERVNSAYQDSFTYQVSDQSGLSSAVATVNLSLSPVNRPPLSEAVYLTLVEDGEILISLPANDPDGDQLTFSLVLPPEGIPGNLLSGLGMPLGTLTELPYFPGEPNLKFVPDANFNGDFQFQFLISDGSLETPLQNAFLTVESLNDAPTALDELATLVEDSEVNFLLQGEDADEDPLTFTVLSSPAHGTLSGTAPNLTYTPEANFFGNDEFTFAVNDGTTTSNVATVSLSVTPVNDQPTALAFTAATLEDTAVSLTLNGSDQEASSLTFTLNTLPTNGVLTGEAPALSYQPAINFNGTDSFTYSVSDGELVSEIVTVSLVVTSENDAPTATSQTFTLDEDSAQTLVLAGSDPEESPLSFEILIPPGSGVLSGDPPNLVYTPNEHFNGSDSFVFIANDGDLDSQPATVTFSIAAVNDAPVATSANFDLNEDDALDFSLSALDIDGDELIYTVIEELSNGVLTGVAPNLSYSPNPDFSGTETFTFSVNDGTAESSLATITLNVLPQPDAPIANPDYLTLEEDSALEITLTGSDADGDPLSFMVTAHPSSGTLSAGSTDSNLVYTPNPDFNGTDCFTYVASDGTLDSSPAIVTFEVTPVNDAPVADAISVTLQEDNDANFVLTGFDPESDALTFVIVTPPSHGTITGEAPNLVYSPNPDFFGEDTLEFVANDGEFDSEPSLGTFTITSINDRPIADELDFTTPEDEAVTFNLSASDRDNDHLTFTIISTPENGVLSGEAPELTYTPNVDFNGSDTFTYTASDNEETSATAAVTLAVTPVNDVPSASHLTLELEEDSSLSVTLSGTDQDGDELTFLLQDPPAHGVLSGTAPELIYTPNPDFAGEDSFTYRVDDGEASSELATVNLQVLPLNDAPTATPLALTLLEDQALPLQLSGSDVDNDPLIYNLVSSPSHGVLVGSPPNLTYQPNPDFFGTDSFSYLTNDGQSSSEPALVSLTIQAVNDPPLAGNLSLETAEDTPHTFSLPVSDPEGDTLAISILTDPSFPGLITLEGEDYRYTPAEDFSGTASFSYLASDPAGLDANGLVDVVVTAVNDPPTAEDIALTATQSDLSLAILLTGSDVEDGQVDFELLSSPSLGNLTGELPSLSYQFDPNNTSPTQSLTDTFTYRTSDSEGAFSPPATVTLTLEPPTNRAPIAEDLELDFVVDDSGFITVLSFHLPAYDLDGDALTFTIPITTSLGFPNGPFSGIAQASNPVGGPGDPGPGPGDPGPGPGDPGPGGPGPGPGPSEVVGNIDPFFFSDVDYFPFPGEVGVTDSFEYTVSDGELTSAPATVTINLIQPALTVPYVSLETDEDTPLTFSLIAQSADDLPVTFLLNEENAGGSFVAGPGGNVFTFVPDENYNGTFFIPYAATDTAANIANNQIRIRVNPVNDPPVITSTTFTVEPVSDSTLIFTASDVDSSQFGLSWNFTTAPDFPGTLTPIGDNAATFTPAPDFGSTAMFVVTVTDLGGASTTGTITLTSSANQAPELEDQSFQALAGVSTDFEIVASDADGDAITLTPALPNDFPGTLSLLSVTPVGGNFRFTPSPAYTDEASFSLVASDGIVDSRTATILLSISPQNSAPVAADLTASIAANQALVTELPATDPNGDPLTFQITPTGLAPGDSFNLNGNEFTFSPDENAPLGDRLLTYTATDDGGLSDTAQIVITVLPPVDPLFASDLTLSGFSGKSFPIELTAGYGNPAVPSSGPAIEYVLNLPPDFQGTLTGTAPSLSYQAPSDFQGETSFTFTASNQTGENATGTVALTITENQPPLAPDIEVDAFYSNLTRTFFLSVFDPDNNLASVSFGTPDSAVLTIDSATLEFVEGSTEEAEVVFSTSLGRRFAGLVTIPYTLFDDCGASASGNILLDISVSNEPPEPYDYRDGFNTSFTLTEDTPTTFPIAIVDYDDDVDYFNQGFLILDYDNDPLTFVFDLSNEPPLSLTYENGNLTITPDANAFGTFEVPYTVTDSLSEPESGLLTIIVTPVNDPALVTPSTLSTNEEQALAFTLAINDVDDDTTAPVASLATGLGTLTGTFPDYVFTPSVNNNGTTSIELEYTDGGERVVTSIPLEVIPINDAPVAFPVSAKNNGNTTELTLNAIDTDGDPLTYRILDPIPGLTVEGNIVRFEPVTSVIGVTSFRYVANDGTVDSNPAAGQFVLGTPPSVIITNPGAGAKSLLGETLSIKTVSSDEDGTIITSALLVNGGVKERVNGGNASFSWTPEAAGDYQLAVAVFDNHGCTTTSAPLAVQITTTNTPPVVFAGSDRSLSGNSLGRNLVQNGDNSLPFESNGSIPFWTSSPEFQWRSGYSSTYFEPASGSGGTLFYPWGTPGGITPEEVTLSQDIDISEWQSEVLAGQFPLLLRARLFTTPVTAMGTSSTSKPAEASIDLFFLSEDNTELARLSFEPRGIDRDWYDLIENVHVPKESTTLRIRLRARHLAFSNSPNINALFDEIELRPIQTTGATLAGTVSDDNLPYDGFLEFSWEQLSGPEISFDPKALSQDLVLTEAGSYTFQLTANDGELASSDTVTFTLTGTAIEQNQPPVIAELPDLTTEFSRDGLPMTATITDDNSLTEDLNIHWFSVSGPKPIVFSDPTSTSTELSFALPGTYTACVTASDGLLTSKECFNIVVTCPAERLPLDLAISIDHTGSMNQATTETFIDFNGIERQATAANLADSLALELIAKLDPARDRVALGKHSGALSPELTFDLELARLALPQFGPETGFVSGADAIASSAYQGIGKMRSHLLAEGRADAEKIIIHIGDGFGGIPPGSTYQSELANEDVTVISVAFQNGNLEPIQYDLLPLWATSTSHFFPLEQNSLNTSEQIFDLIASATCLSLNEAPVVDAGESRGHPDLLSPFVPQGKANDDGLPANSNLSFQWTQLYGPGSASFSDPSLLNPGILFPIPGQYRLRLEVSDGSLTSSDTITVFAAGECPAFYPPGLIALWDFNDSLSDLIGDRRIQAAVDPDSPFKEDAIFGKALDLSSLAGISQFPHSGTSLDLGASNQPFTASFWFKATEPSSTGGGFLIGSSSSQELITIAFDPSNNTISTQLKNGASLSATGSSQTGWNHYTLVHQENRSAQLFVNGNLSSSPSFQTSDREITNVRLTLAAGNSLLDELTIFDRALTEAEIVSLYQNTSQGLCLPSLNPAPIVEAGADFQIEAPALTAALQGFVLDDTAPAISWRKISGPGTVSFSNDSEPRSSATFSAPGHYTLQLTANDGYQEASDLVEIRVALPCSPPPAGLLSWLSLNGTFSDKFERLSSPLLRAEQTFAPGTVGEALSFAPETDSIFFANEEVDPTLDGNYTMELWLRLDDFPASGTANLIDFLTPSSRDVRSRLMTSTGKLRFTAFAGNNFTSLEDPNPIIPGQFDHLVITATPSSLTLYRNGIAVDNSTVSGSNLWTHPLNNSISLNSFAGNTRLATGLFDELSFYDRALSAAEVSALFNLGSNGKCLPASNPSLLVDAGSDVILASGDQHTFAASVQGAGFAGSPGFLWTQLTGPVEIPLSDETTLSPTALFSVPGRYQFQLTATDGTLTESDTVTIDVTAPMNTAPTLELTATATSLTLPNTEVTVSTILSDDGLPANRLLGKWTVTGPSSDLPTFETEVLTGQPSLTSSLVLPGLYTFTFELSDEEFTVTDSLTVEVLPEVVLPPTDNTPPTVSLGADLTLSTNQWQANANAMDDGLPSTGSLRYQWGFLSGPAQPLLNAADLPNPQFTFPTAGNYELVLTVSDGELSATDTIAITVPENTPGLANQPPAVSLVGTVGLTLPQNTGTYTATITDDGRSPQPLTYLWSQVSGPAASITNPDATETTITYPTSGSYLFRFTVLDGPYSISNTIAVEVQDEPVNPVDPGLPGTPNLPPVITLDSSPSASPGLVPLAAVVSDDGEPAGSTLTYRWHLLQGPALPPIQNPESLNTSVDLSQAGNYLFRLDASDGASTSSAFLNYQIIADPFLVWVSPLDGEAFTDLNAPRLQVQTDQLGGAITRIEFFKDGQSLGTATRDEGFLDAFLDLPPLDFGFHTITATVTTANGQTLSADTTFEYLDYDEAQLELAFESPSDSDTITEPTAVFGTAFSNRFQSYRLEIQEVAPNVTDAPVQLIEQSNAGVREGLLGTLDPTLLENGLYDLILTGQTTTGIVQELRRSVIIDGAMKLGQFTLAFEDLSVPLSGIPMSVTRTYDSRDALGGDFGPGWNLGVKNISLRTGSTVGEGWSQTQIIQSGPLPLAYHVIEPTRRKRISLFFPDGRTEIFEAKVFIPEARRTVPPSILSTGFTLPSNAQLYAPVTSAQIRFEPIGNTSGQLELAINETEFLWIPQSQEGNTTFGSFDLFGQGTLDPKQFRYTEDDGTSYLLDETFGLRSATDTNENTLTITDDGIFHSSGEEILFTRDHPKGYITKVTDPAGNEILYSYNSDDLLSTITNREGETTRFFYEEPAFPHYLSRIRDPRGQTALASTYDDDGRLIAQRDALGNEVTLGHDLAQNREVITDRLGNRTTHYFDDYGNITRTIDALGGETLMTYDDRDNETSVTTPLGFTTTRNFDEKDNLLSETDPLGNVTNYSYSSDERPLTIADALSRTTTLTYDGSRNLDSMADPTGAETTFGYNSRGDLSTLTDAVGTTTTYTHDSKGRELTMAVTDSDGNTLRSESYTYDSNGNRLTSTTTRTLADGTVETLLTSFDYDAENRVTQTTYPDGSTTSVTYNNIGKQATTTDQLGRVTSFTYDTRGNLTRTDFPDGTFTQTFYDFEGRAIANRDQLGRISYTVYDALGRVTASIQPGPTDLLGSSGLNTPNLNNQLSGGLFSDHPISFTEYDADSRVIATIDPNGNRTEFEYDAAGRRTLVRDALGNITTTVYDDAGQQDNVTDALGRTTSFTYDLAGRLTRTDFPDSTFTTITYDALGRRTQTTDQEGIPTGYQYDALGRLTAVHQANPVTGLLDEGKLITTYAYDEQGNQLSQTDAEGRTTQYTYDLLGRRTSRTLPGGQVETMTYNLDGTIATRTDFNGYTTTYTYEAETSRLLTVTADPSHPSLTLPHAPASLRYTYDDGGQRSTAATLDSSGAILHQESWTYDQLGRNIEKITPHGTLGYTYDRAGNLLTAQSSNDNGLMSAHSYDALNRLATTSDNSVSPAFVQAYSYDRVGNLQTSTAGNGLTHRYSYSNLNRLTHLSIGTLSEASNPLSDFATLGASHTYTLNQAGHRTAVEDYRNIASQTSTRTINYTYDKLYRLTSETVAATSGPPVPTGTISYTHDKVGNRLSRTSSTEFLRALLPDQTQAYNANDQLTDHTHDANGNTTSSPTPLGSVGFQPASTVSDIYDFRNKLIRRTLPDGSTIDLAYNADALLVSKRTDKLNTETLTNFLQDTNNHTGYAQIVEELSENTTTGELEVYALNVPGHDLLHTHQLSTENSQTANWQTSFYLYDGLGSVRALANDSGAITDTFDYDAFGTLLHSTGDTPNAYLYTGERFDPDLGFYYLRARYHDPNLGRFHTLDTYEGRNGEPLTLHKYLYTHANPVNFIDPSGNAISTSEQSATLATLNRFVNIGLTNVRLGFAVGRQAGGAALRNLGIRVERAVAELLKSRKGIEILRRNAEITGPGGRRFIDFLIQIKDRLIFLEVKFKIPSRAGSAMTRLVNQVSTATAQQGARTVVFTFRKASEAELRLLTQQLAKAGVERSSVQLIQTLPRLARWLRLVSL